MNPVESLELEHDADVGMVRRRVATVAAAAGLDETRGADAALIATELASNVIKHARHGGLLLGELPAGVAMIAWDRGPGMNVAACMRDGMSTAGTAGNGLGAVKRLATSMDAYARPNGGAVIAATVCPRGERRRTAFEVGGVAVPYPGLRECGDAWAVVEHGDSVTVIVCDGLGHGEPAAAASRAVLGVFATAPERDPVEILEHAHAAAKATRGAAAAIVRIDRVARHATIAAVGNIGAWIVGESSRQLVTQHGTIGQTTPRIRPERYEFPRGAHLVVCSDGLKSRLPFGELGELFAHTPLAIAAALWRDHARGRDDACAVVVRETRGGA